MIRKTKMSFPLYKSESKNQLKSIKYLLLDTSRQQYELKLNACTMILLKHSVFHQ